jgi:hypothetical protein
MRTPIRASMLSHFSKAMWNRWLKDLNGPDEQDPQYRYLSKGIAAFRRQLAAKEAKKAT